MSYQPVVGDEIKFRNVAPWNRHRVYRIDQVVLTDESQILGVVISIEHPNYPHKRQPSLFDYPTFEGFDPVKVGHDALRDDDTKG